MALIQIFVSLFLLISSFAYASSSANRFIQVINGTQQILEKTLFSTKDSSELKQTEALSKAGFRVSVFKLQSLGRIYSYHPDQDIKEFATKLRKKSKTIEDLMGRWDMYTTVKKDKEAKKAVEELFVILKNDNWIKKNSAGEIFQNWQNKIKNMNWPSDESDRDFVIKVLANQINTTIETDYDMSLLQAGMHEIRRELRWFLIYSLVLDGVIQKSNTGPLRCPLRRLQFKEFVDEKYASLKTDRSIKNFCPISACIYDEIVGAVGVFGEIKDQAEEVVEKNQKMLEDDTNPSPFKEKGEQYYAILKSTQVLEIARTQLLECTK